MIEKVSLPNGCEVIVAGIGTHTTDLNQMKNVIEALEQTITDKGGNNVVFLGEGGYINPQESAGVKIKKGCDQFAMVSRAKELRVSKLDSWDLSIPEQIDKATELLGPENAFLWILSQSAISLRSSGEKINLQNILTLLSNIGVGKEELEKHIRNITISQNLDTEESLDQFMINHAGFSLKKVNDDESCYKSFSQVAWPWNNDEIIQALPEGLRKAALVAKQLSVVRDKRFKEKINMYSQQGKVIFVSCGGAHVQDFIKILKHS